MFADRFLATAAKAVAARIVHGAQRKNRRKWMYCSLKVCFVLLLITTATWSQATPDFSGLWEQDNDRCQPKRTGEVTLHIEHHGAELVVETSIAYVSARPKRAVQKYVINGKVSVSTGADGDEFHTKVIRRGSSLVFTIEEHEDGHILHSQETWSLIENNATLERIRERSNGEKQVLFYRRGQSSLNEPL
jgi:hypothetical protein